jgi:pimeloyl-ACP methyl ester carboxylesterase
VALADAVDREMDQLGIGDFHVAGYSLGARVSLELATRGRIRSVVAIGPDGLAARPSRAGPQSWCYPSPGPEPGGPGRLRTQTAA